MGGQRRPRTDIIVRFVKRVRGLETLFDGNGHSLVTGAPTARVSDNNG